MPVRVEPENNLVLQQTNLSLVNNEPTRTRIRKPEKRIKRPTNIEESNVPQLQEQTYDFSVDNLIGFDVENQIFDPVRSKVLKAGWRFEKPYEKCKTNREARLVPNFDIVLPNHLWSVELSSWSSNWSKNTYNVYTDTPWFALKEVFVAYCTLEIDAVSFVVEGKAKRFVILAKESRVFLNLANFAKYIKEKRHLVTFLLWCICVRKFWRTHEEDENYFDFQRIQHPLTNNLENSLWEKALLLGDGSFVDFIQDQILNHDAAVVLLQKRRGNSQIPTIKSLLQFGRDITFEEKSVEFSLKHASIIAEQSCEYAVTRLSDLNREIAHLMKKYYEILRESAVLEAQIQEIDNLAESIMESQRALKDHFMVKSIGMQKGFSLHIESHPLLIDLEEISRFRFISYEKENRFRYTGNIRAEIDFVHKSFVVRYDNVHISPNGWCTGTYHGLMVNAMANFQFFDMWNLLINYLLVRDGNNHASFGKSYETFASKEEFLTWFSKQNPKPLAYSHALIGDDEVKHPPEYELVDLGSRKKFQKLNVNYLDEEET